MADRVWIVNTIPLPPASPSTLAFGHDAEAARTAYITQITALGAPQEKIDHDSTVALTTQTTLQYTDPVSGTRVVLTTTRA